MLQRHTYKSANAVAWQSLPNPVATKKYDGANFFMRVQPDGSIRFFSRIKNVAGEYTERTEKVPHLTSVKLPQYAGHDYTVELIHTGHNKESKENHPMVSGLLNSLAPRALAMQKEHGPIRAVLIDVLNPPLPKYPDKIAHMKELEEAFGKPGLMFVPEIADTNEKIVKLIQRTKDEGHEGVIVTSATLPEANNPRIKMKHQMTYNLRVKGIIQEKDKNGNPKPSAGALELEDASGRDVGKVGTGFSKELREEIYKNPLAWKGKLIQIKSRGILKAEGKLKEPVFNGDADGDIDLVEFK